MRNLSDIVASVHADLAEHIGGGKVADYIPALSRVDPRRFGLAVVTCTGEHVQAGDANVPFSIQSISKVFTLTLALERVGARLWHRVGREPSGSPFNSIVQLEQERGVPRNPFINAGALVVTDALLTGRTPKATAAEILAFLRERADDPSVSIDDEVAGSEAQTGFRNARLHTEGRRRACHPHHAGDVLRCRHAA